MQANDTTGDLAGAIYYSKENVAAITLGMGTDVGYVESAEQVPKWHGQSPNSGEMVTN